ncbi:MAG: hypothetical protein K2Y30_01320 [Flavobacteriaceae bacterium]|nr:hypothetical protein [Flavobacteriaceae bacterium]
MRKTVRGFGLLNLFLDAVGFNKTKNLKIKKITIELTEEQYAKMTNHLQKGTALNVDNDTFSGYSLHLNCVDGGIASWLELEMNGSLNLGDVNWNIE